VGEVRGSSVTDFDLELTHDLVVLSFPDKDREAPRDDLAILVVGSLAGALGLVADAIEIVWLIAIAVG